MGCTLGLLALLCFLASVWVVCGRALKIWGRYVVASYEGKGGGERGVGTCSVGYEYVIFGG